MRLCSGLATAVLLLLSSTGLDAEPTIRPASAAAPMEAELGKAAERAGLRRIVLVRALAARARVAASGVSTRPVLTVIDYSLPSRERRLWVLDLARSRVVAHEFVAHGRHSGDDFARRFSNRPGSLESSLGTFITGAVYAGKYGLSLRLRGLDPGVNDRAADRAIVIHGAWYVSQWMVARMGRVGRSQGCPALSRAAAPRVIGLIRDGTVLYAYFRSIQEPSPGVGPSKRPNLFQIPADSRH